jgi:hypothetical protein
MCTYQFGEREINIIVNVKQCAQKWVNSRYIIAQLMVLITWQHYYNLKTNTYSYF